MRFLMRAGIAAVMVVFALITYCSTRQENPVTGETQHISMTPDQEIALGLEAAPQMAGQMGGLHPSERVQEYVDNVGRAVVARSSAQKGPYEYRFHVLADAQTVNAFALPGGQIFITSGLLARLENEAQLAGVLGHEVGHVVGRHAAEHIAKGELSQRLVNAAGVAAYDPGSPGGGMAASAVAAMVAKLTTLRYGRNDELEADSLGIDFMSEADYDPRAMSGVMDVLEGATTGQGGGPDWLQTHPDPGNRRERIREIIEEKFSGNAATLSTGDPAQFRAIQAELVSNQ